MTSDELDRLAGVIAAELERALRAAAAAPDNAGNAAAPWVPAPVRPAPPGPPGPPPAWSGAAQSLGDIAPSSGAERPTRRDAIGDATAAIRAAAAGKGPVRGARAASARAPHGPSRARGATIEVPVGVSNRHVHLASADAEALFGAALTVARPLTQPGQFAAKERVCVSGPKGRIEGIRVVGPARGATQLELSLADLAVLGIDAPVANSGQLAGSTGGVTLDGPRGKVRLAGGVIAPARHLHLSPEDGRRWHLADGDTVSIRCGVGPREVTWHGVLVRCGDAHATEFHLDVDEARAAGVLTGAVARIVGSSAARPARRTLVTERDVVALAARGERLPAGALLTPRARDRARGLGLL